MGFFSDLAGLGRDLGAIAKDSAKKIGGIIEEGRQEFLVDPKKFTADSIKEIGVAAGTAAKYVATDVVPYVLKNGPTAINSSLNKKYNELLERDDISNEQREKIISNKKTTLSNQIKLLTRNHENTATELEGIIAELEQCKEKNKIEILNNKKHDLERTKNRIISELSEAEKELAEI